MNTASQRPVAIVTGAGSGIGKGCAIHFAKAGFNVLVNDMNREAIEKVAAEILKTDDVGRIKELGRQVSNYDESRWNGMRQILVYEGLLAKFEQNEDLKAQLKSTGDAILAECAVKDHIWGIGLSMKDPDRLDVKKWHGTNLLGYALMIVRERV